MSNKACGIICEYNPFHNGHKYQIEYIKNNYGMPVVCAMSGNFVQRGEPACVAKQARAKAAVEAGATVVLEIPFPYCSMTAERFAAAGVAILDKCGMCSHIAFGSECADVEILDRIAEFLLTPVNIRSIQMYQKKNPNHSYASCRYEIIKAHLGEECAQISKNPNDILAIEYIKAIKRSASKLIPVAIKRTVDRGQTADGCFASSSVIRALMKQGEYEKALEYMPDNEQIQEEFNLHEAFYEMIHLALMTKNADSLSEICELGGGLEYAVVNAAKNSSSYEEMFEKLKSKSLTDAKIRRMLLFAFFGITRNQSASEPLYTMVLALGKGQDSAELMRIARKQKRIVVAQRISTIKRNAEVGIQYEFCRNAEKLLDYTGRLKVNNGDKVL